MKKSICAVLLAISATIQPNIVSNQTYLRARDSLSNNIVLARCGTAYGTLTQKNRLGGTLSIAPYYRAAHNTRGIAQTFGTGQEVNGDQDGTIVVLPGQSAPENPQSDTYNLYSQAIDHTAVYNASAPESQKGMSGTMTLSPTRTEYGAHISWQQKLDFLSPSLSLAVEMPIVNVTTHLNSSITGDFAHAESTYGQAGSTLAEYFKGKKFTKTANSAQDALKYAKIDGMSHSKASIADIQVGLKYALFTDSDTRVFATGIATLPVSKKNTATYLFEPTVGSGHVSLGGSLNGMTSLYRNGAHRITAQAGLHYRYLLKAEETRTLGIYDHWYKVIGSGSQYRNLGLVGATSVTPAANVLTRTVVVKPGQVVDAVIGARYHYETISASLTYNLHGHEAENVSLAPISRWFDGQYGLMGHAAAADVHTAIVVGSDDFTYGGALQQEGNTGAITKDSNGDDVGDYNAAHCYISTAACAGRADLTHKVAACIEWNYVKWQWPFTVSCGVEYELPHTTNSNSGIHSWAAWSKLSVCF